MSKRIRFMTALLAAVLAGCGAVEPPAPKFQSTDITGVEWGRDFPGLTDPGGAPRSIADFRGKVVLVFFGYTHCPDMCPTTLAKMAAAVRRLGADGEGVQGLFITLDPKRDTPDVLAQYVPAFHPTFLGLRGDEATTARTAQDFKVFFSLQPPDAQDNYTVDHQAAIFAFDPQGRLRLYIRADAQVETIVHDVRELLRTTS